MSLLQLQTTSTLSAASAQLNRSGKTIARQTERLSSGEAITRAGDDVANLSVANRLLTQTTSLRSSIINLAQADSLLQTADAGLAEIDGILQRMNVLSTMASNGSLSSAERGFLNQEFDQLKDQIDDTAENTSFNGIQVLNGGQREERVIDTSLTQTILASETNGIVDVGIGNQRVIGTEARDVINTGKGNDTIIGGTGVDRIDAGSGDDVIVVDAQNDRIPNLAITDGLQMRIDGSNGVNVNAQNEVTSITDRTGNGNNALVEINNAVVGESTMNGRQSLLFDGTDIMRVADDGAINNGPQDERSIFISFETGNDIDNRQVLYEQGGTASGFNIYIEGGQLFVGAWNGSGGTLDLFLSVEIDINQSYNAGFVFDFANTQTLTGYLNGTEFGTLAVGANQNAHNQDIGIGGQNQQSRFANSGGDGNDRVNIFQGEIGEILNYDRALAQSEAGAVSGYLLSKWQGSQDYVDGGSGFDRVQLLGEGQSFRLAGDGAGGGLRNIEYIDLNGNDRLHEISIDDSYFEENDILDNTLYIDASENQTGIRVDARGLSAEYQVIILGSAGDDTLFGDNLGNVSLSYEHFEGVEGKSGGVLADLDFKEFEAYGDDELLGVNQIRGTLGDDEIIGGQGGDTLIGGAGNDIIRDIDISGGALITSDLLLFLDSTNEASVTTAGNVVTNVADQSGNGNDAFPLTGQVLYGIDEINNNPAFTFSGGASLQIADTPTINTTGQAERTMFATFRTGDDINTRQFIYEEGGPVHGYSFYIQNGRVFIGAFTATGAINDIYVSEAIEPNTTYVVGGAFNANSGTLSLYLNGKLFATEVVNGPQQPHPNDIGVGGVDQTSRTDTGNAPAGTEFTGLIGEILLYDIAFDLQDAKTLNNYLRALRFQGGSDSMVGGEGNDSITGGQLNDTIDGGSGDDTAFYTGKSNEYTIERLDDGSVRVRDLVAERDGTDIVLNVESLSFADQTVGINTAQEGNASFAVNFNGNGQLDIRLPNASAQNLLGNRDVNLLTLEDALVAQNAVVNAIDSLTSIRADIGSFQSSVDILRNATDSALQNQIAARGVVFDTDIAREATSYALELAKYQLASSINAQTNTLRREVVLGIIEDGIDVGTLEN